jgi:hypothetical protein
MSRILNYNELSNRSKGFTVLTSSFVVDRAAHNENQAEEMQLSHDASRLHIKGYKPHIYINGFL